METLSRRSVLLALALTTLLAAEGCVPTSHAVAPSTLGTPSRSSAMEASLATPGPLEVETVVGADWAIDRSGLLNLDHPKAKAAGLTDGIEPIQILFHALRHPTRGLYLIDTGVERALVGDPDHAIVHGFMSGMMHLERMVVRVDTRTWLERQPAAPAGVFLTHVHVDHVSGMRDVPSATPVFVGPGDTRERGFLNLFVAPIMDDALAGKGALAEWSFSPDPDGAFEGVLDVFGDGSLWAISVPGHTPGSTAYLARTPHGPVLMVGDACHTAWGWQHGVEPGTFSDDMARSADSLRRLQAFASRHPEMEVKLGHQQLPR